MSAPFGLTLRDERDKWPLIGGNPVPYLNALRDGKNEDSVYPADRVAYPVGKINFDRFVTQHGGRAPCTLARIEGGRVSHGDRAGQDLRGFLDALPPGNYFCKPDDGAKGIGVFRLDVLPSGIQVDGKAQSTDSVEALLSSCPYLLQHSLVPRQHAGMARFSGGAINTIRLMIFDTEAGPCAAGAMVRLSNGAVVDNWNAGGVAVPVDLARGALGKAGCVKEDFARVEVHAGSGIRFFGEPIPYLEEAIALTCRLQARLPVRSLGWDVAVLKDGPCILEANVPWDVYVAPQIVPGFLETFLAYHVTPPEVTKRISVLGTFTNRDTLRLWLAAVVGRSLAAGRVDALSGERLVLTVSGSQASLDAVLYRMKKSVARFQAQRMTLAPSGGSLRAGLDIEGSFAGGREP